MLSSSSTHRISVLLHMNASLSSLEENMRSVNEDRVRVEEDPAISTSLRKCPLQR